jgi:glycosyltransferase involved in cell wall biosynthesis
VTLDSIAEHCSSDVVVVDDGSPAEYQEYVHELCERRGFRFIVLPENYGISTAKNTCLHQFQNDRRYEYLIMLDDDVKVISDEFESTYTTAMELSGVGILSWNDPAYTGASPEPHGELVASNHTCGCCVVVSRECVEQTGGYLLMPGKWGREHSEYYQRAAVKFGKPGVYLDVPNSKELLVLASNASVFTHEEKLASNEVNRIYLGAES